MSINKTKSSIAFVQKKNGQVIGYLSKRDFAKGLNEELASQGYIIGKVTQQW